MILLRIGDRIKRASPGSLVTAAFIGPGTITTCIKAGYTRSYSLLPIMIVAAIVAIFIQFFAAKVGLITQTGLSRTITRHINSKILKYISCIFIICAIFIGNCAFEAGNITGAALGIQMLLGFNDSAVFVIFIAMIVAILLWIGKFEWLQTVLKIVVFIMAGCLFIAAILIRPSIWNIFQSFGSIDFSSDTVLIGALIGTTIGPYSIFLHSSAAAQHWHSTNELREMCLDTVISISIGGLISCCIIVVAAATADVMNIQELTIENFGMSLEMPLGILGQKLFLIGLFSAGLSSAITAPLAAAYTVAEMITDMKVDTQGRIFRFTWIIVVVIGILTSMLWGTSPANLIIFAQYANALILPFITAFLLYILNSQCMGKYKNKIWENGIVLFLILVSLLLMICSLQRLQT